MNYLLDTCAVVFFFENSDKMSEKIKSVISDKNNSIFVSYLTFWELSLKMSLKKYKGAFNFELDMLYNFLIDYDFEIINLDLKHFQMLKTLEEIHGDPFDRLLIATAKSEDFIIITSDENIQRYSIKTLW
ncbi:MAG: type II toxin-antitoxin system VapC family toxin [Oscillospiraceae bacterium]|jgi:PIN domain nuclease of toxin-antitoxin system|nr:type II toxin-antitoxin system VapC family toxin [Oscillospiraceae bacterium]